ncbi:MAG: molybdenum cofactor synthesis domain-containing protein [Pseudomonadota bacterium]|nr:molybdenum cofactor synthesis domain-containing protein [Pseudomonadota bacterium]
MNIKAKIKNNCFALPKGVNWCPVDTALRTLKENLHTVCEPMTISTLASEGHTLSQSIHAEVSNPSFSNSAVDGYGFSGSTNEGLNEFSLMSETAFAGAPFIGRVPQFHAIQIMTGASLPTGVDTVVLNEDVTLDNRKLTFSGKLKTGSNVRLAGEDVLGGDLLFDKGHRLRPQDLALLIATGVKNVEVYEPLRVGVLSTGNEVLEPSSSTKNDLDEAMIFDSNRPMLSSLINKWGCDVIDVGLEIDDIGKIRQKLNMASENCDVLLTTGGASAGCADYLSKLIKEEGTLFEWRIAVKPGRPLAMGVWKGMPVFGLPGNPVAAYVCALIFFYPAMCSMSGSGWQEPQAFWVPANFQKTKLAGRREFLRARLNEKSEAEIFRSEGSGRISGLSWSTGLVELPDKALEINKGDDVKYIPYSSFGI